MPDEEESFPVSATLNVVDPSVPLRSAITGGNLGTRAPDTDDR